MTREELRDAIADLLPHGKTGGWLDGDWRSDDAHDKAQTYLLCPKHGERAVRLLRHLRGDTRDIHWTPCWAGDDAVRHCDVCGVELDLGGLTSYGVDDALDPDHVPTAEELRQAADAMVDGDPRWARWTEAAEELLAASAVVNPYSDLPAWIWEVPVNGHPRLFLSTPDTYGNHHVLLWRWCLFLYVCHPRTRMVQDGNLWTWVPAQGPPDGET